MRPTNPFAAPNMSREDAAIARSFARRQLPIAVGGCNIDVIAPPRAIADPVTLGIGPDLGTAALPRGLRDALLAGLDPAAPAADADAGAMLLELAIEPALALLRATCPDLDPSLSAATVPARDAHDALGLSVHVGGQAHGLRLDLPRSAALAVALALDARPAVSASWPTLNVPVRVRQMATDLPLSALRALREGDVILADRLPADNVLLVAGEHLLWRARRSDHATGTTLTIETPRTAARAGFEGWMMADDTNETPDAGPADASLDDLPIRVVFELGRLELPLSELAAIGPGHVFELTRDPDQPLDIVAHGQRIGRGRIVAVGDDIGVQVVWIKRPG